MTLDCCHPSHPLARDGTSQQQRYLPALAPDSVKLDSRSLAQLLLWAKEYARDLVFYDAKNSITGDWQKMLENDPTLLVAMVSLYDTASLRAAFNTASEMVKQTNGATKLVAFKSAAQQLIALAALVDGWYGQTAEELAFHTDIANAIKADMVSAIARLKSYDLGAEDALGAPLALNYKPLLVGSRLWLLNEGIKRSEIYKGATADEKLDAALANISGLFTQMYGVIVRLVHDAPKRLEESLNYPQHQPHMALYIAFLKLFGLLQEGMNGLTARHLDFYYQTVLRLKHKPPVPDRAHMLFALSPKRTEPYLLEAGTEFTAGKDETGTLLTYAVGQDTVINQASIVAAKALFLDRQLSKTALYASPIAISADGQGAEFADPVNARWKTFGQDKTRPEASVGMVIASPLLFLAEGTRVITLTAEIPHAPALVKPEDIFAVSLSTDEGWLDVSDKLMVQVKNDDISFIISLPSETVAIAPFGAKYLAASPDDKYATTAPLMKIEITSPDYYPDFSKLAIENLALKVNVSGMRALVLANDFGDVPADKPAFAFGTKPKPGSSFLVGSWEVMQKNLDKMTISLDWLEMPDLGKHYEDYYQSSLTSKAETPSAGKLDNETISCQVDFQDNSASGGWRSIATGQKLFAGKKVDIELKELDSKWNAKPTAKKFDRFDAGLSRGFVRLSLDSDLLHDLYPKIYAEIVLKIAKGDNTLKLVNAPFISQLKSVTLGYEANEANLLTQIEAPETKKLMVKSAASRKQEGNILDKTIPFIPRRMKFVMPKTGSLLFHLYPFGHRLVDDISPALAPAFQHTIYRFAGNETRPTQGELYLGLANTPDGDSSYQLSILFQVSEGTSDPAIEINPQIVWSYLSGNDWQVFKPEEILRDGTKGLIQPGIITFTMPRLADTAHSLLPDGYVWIRASVHEDPAGVCDMVGVHAQAAEVIFTDKGNDPNHLATPLPAGSIAKMVNKPSAIASFVQPYATFGGAVEELQPLYYRRVSERLRHKDRAITIWDYERLVLENMPNIYKVKTLSHTGISYEPAVVLDDELKPGYVSVVVIPRVLHKTGVDLREPRASQALRTAVYDMLAARAPRAIKENIRVLNPLYEQVTVKCSVVIGSAYDEGMAIAQLKQDLEHYFCPWAFEDGADIAFGGRIHESAVVDFINERDYVENVHNFQLYQTYNGSRVPVKEAVTHSARSILVSAPAEEHTILGGLSDCNCS